jgi:heme-degrading monooxygenase HmoA
MFARVTRATLPSDKLDQGIAMYRETILPSLASQPGFRGGLLLVDRGSGTGRTITFYADEAALRDSEAMSAEARAQARRDAGAHIREPETYEVVFHHRIAPLRPNAFVRINEAQGSIEHIDDLLEFARTQVFQALQSQPGWLAMQLMTNRQTGRSLIMSVWDSEASRDGSDSALRVLREQGAMTMGAASVEVSVYEAVVVQVDESSFPMTQKAPA